MGTIKTIGTIVLLLLVIGGIIALIVKWDEFIDWVKGKDNGDDDNQTDDDTTENDNQTDDDTTENDNQTDDDTTENDNQTDNDTTENDNQTDNDTTENTEIPISDINTTNEFKFDGKNVLECGDCPGNESTLTKWFHKRLGYIRLPSNYSDQNTDVWVVFQGILSKLRNPSYYTGSIRLTDVNDDEKYVWVSLTTTNIMKTRPTSGIPLIRLKTKADRKKGVLNKNDVVRVDFSSFNENWNDVYIKFGFSNDNTVPTNLDFPQDSEESPVGDENGTMENMECTKDTLNLSCFPSTELKGNELNLAYPITMEGVYLLAEHTVFFKRSTSIGNTIYEYTLLFYRNNQLIQESRYMVKNENTSYSIIPQTTDVLTHFTLPLDLGKFEVRVRTDADVFQKIVFKNELLQKSNTTICTIM